MNNNEIYKTLVREDVRRHSKKMAYYLSIFLFPFLFEKSE
jgi:hypothetical protein